MSDPLNDAIAERLGRLEGEVERLARENLSLSGRLDAAQRAARSRRVMVAIVALGLAFAALTVRAGNARGPKVVEAEQFLLRDRDGARKADLFVASGGIPALSLYNKKDQCVFQLTARDEGTSLTLNDDEGRRVLQITAWHDRSAGLKVLDPNGKARLTIGGGADGRFGLTIYDSEEHSLVGIGTDKVGGAGLTIQDPDGRTRANLIRNRDGALGFVITDQNGRILFRAPQP